MAAGLVAVAQGAQGAEGTEELWTWAMGAAPSGSQTHRSKPTNRSTNRAATFKHSIMRKINSAPHLNSVSLLLAELSHGFKSVLWMDKAHAHFSLMLRVYCKRNIISVFYYCFSYHLAIDIFFLISYKANWVFCVVFGMV